MKIISKGRMPNGVKIQLEDWSEDYPGITGLMIGAYPIALATDKYGWVRAGELFRLSISDNKYAGYTNEMVANDYNELILGTKKLEDLADHFWGGDKDKWRLGMFVPGTDEWLRARMKY